MPIPVIAIFDIGKTNKKLFLFSEEYKVLYEKSIQLEEITDEEGDPCEDIAALNRFLLESLQELSQKEFDIKAINYSAYGASFVYIDEYGKAVTPLYNYLKSYPSSLQRELYGKYGGEEKFSLDTASPVLGSLNSGLQLFRVKKQRPDLFQRIKFALHLPQYISSLFTQNYCSDITSIGCHTALWDFSQNRYHDWVIQEGLMDKMAPILLSNTGLPIEIGGKQVVSGVGLHDSSAALIPYLLAIQEPFVLISTGTWCISMNPINSSPLTVEELRQDCLCYYTFDGRPVKASRLFAGNEHELQAKRLAAHFHKPADFYKQVRFDPHWPTNAANDGNEALKLENHDSFESAYHHLLARIVSQQVVSTNLVLKGQTVKKIFIDGGFSQNDVYMNLLANAFPQLQIFSASMPQATAVGAATAIHGHWSQKPIPKNIIALKPYTSRKQALNL